MTLHWTQSGDIVHHGGHWRHAFLLGAAGWARQFIVACRTIVSSYTQNWMFFIGMLFVLIVLFFPRGVLGIVRRKLS